MKLRHSFTFSWPFLAPINAFFFQGEFRTGGGGGTPGICCVSLWNLQYVILPASRILWWVIDVFKMSVVDFLSTCMRGQLHIA